MSQTQTRRSSQVDLLHGPILKSLLLFALRRVVCAVIGVLQASVCGLSVRRAPRKS